MKRIILALILLAGFIAIPAMAQDFTSPKPQFVSFNFGVLGGYSLDSEDIVGANSFGVNIAVIENMEVGFERLNTVDANLFRLAYYFGNQFGAAIGIGNVGTGVGNAGMSLGLFGNFFQARAANGLAYSLGMRADYLARTNAFDNGSIYIGLRAGFGL